MSGAGSGLRETFATRLGVLASMIGVAVGLGNVWRFPYMAGRYGGAAFILAYALAALAIGVPALMAEWALGRHTRRGTVGAFERAGLPAGRRVGWFFFAVVTAATAYYVNVIGWVVWHGVAVAAGPGLDGGWILPPETGFSGRALGLQLVATTAILGVAAAVLVRGLRAGIERVSTVVTPLLFGALLLVAVRSLTLPGSAAGVAWLLAFEPGDLTPGVALAGLSQVVFSVALGGTFMVVYGSYLDADHRLGPDALYTVLGDTGAGLLAGLAIFPAVFALGLEPAEGPGLLFSTLPDVFARMPWGRAVGTLFFGALAAVAFLSAVAALEVLVAGLTDNTRLTRRQATRWMTAGVLLVAVPPMLSMQVFVPWDLTFGSGMQTLGALVAALTFGWALDRGAALRALVAGPERVGGRSGDVEAVAGDGRRIRLLYLWIRWVIPGVILAVGVWWVLSRLGPG